MRPKAHPEASSRAPLSVAVVLTFTIAGCASLVGAEFDGFGEHKAPPDTGPYDPSDGGDARDDRDPGNRPDGAAATDGPIDGSVDASSDAQTSNDASPDPGCSRLAAAGDVLAVEVMFQAPHGALRGGTYAV